MPEKVLIHEINGNLSYTPEKVVTQRENEMDDCRSSIIKEYCREGCNSRGKVEIIIWVIVGKPMET